MPCGRIFSDPHLFILLDLGHFTLAILQHNEHCDIVSKERHFAASYQIKPLPQIGLPEYQKTEFFELIQDRS